MIDLNKKENQEILFRSNVKGKESLEPQYVEPHQNDPCSCNRLKNQSLLKINDRHLAKTVADVDKTLDKVYRAMDHFQNICLVYNIIEVNKQGKNHEKTEETSHQIKYRGDYTSQTLSSQHKVKERTRSVDHLAKLSEILHNEETNVRKQTKGSKTDRINSHIQRFKPLRKNKSALNLLPNPLDKVNKSTKNTTNIFMNQKMVHADLLADKINALNVAKSRKKKPSSAR